MKLNKTKKSFKQTLLAMALGSIAMGSLAISASETEVHQIMIKMDKTDGNNAMVDLKIDGVAEAFSIPDLEVGQSKTITTDSGKSITVSKTENGLSIDVDGKNIELPGLSGNLAAHIQRSMPLHQIMENSIQISGVELDENQKQIIKEAFIAAGIEKKISFSKGNFMVFSTDNSSGFSADQFVFKSGDHDLQWVSKDNAVFEVKLDSNSDSEVEVHTQFIHVEETED